MAVSLPLEVKDNPFIDPAVAAKVADVLGAHRDEDSTTTDAPDSSL